MTTDRVPSPESLGIDPTQPGWFTRYLHATGNAPGNDAHVLRVSHPIDLSVLASALELAPDSVGVRHTDLRSRVEAARLAANARDRARQDEGFRAAND